MTAMTNKELIEALRAKLRAHGVQEPVPDPPQPDEKAPDALRDFVEDLDQWKDK